MFKSEHSKEKQTQCQYFD